MIENNYISFSSESILSANMIDSELVKGGSKAFLVDTIAVLIYLKTKNLNHLYINDEKPIESLRERLKECGVDNYTINKLLYGYKKHPELFHKLFVKSKNSNRVLNLKSGKGAGVHLKFYFSETKISDNELNRGMDVVKPGVFIKCDKEGNFKIRDIKEALKEAPFFMNLYRTAVTSLYGCTTESDKDNAHYTLSSWKAENRSVLSVKKSVRSLMLQEGCCIQTAERRKKGLLKFFDISFRRDEEFYNDLPKEQIEKMMDDCNRDPFNGIVVVKANQGGGNTVIIKRSDIFRFGTSKLYSYRKVGRRDSIDALKLIKDCGKKIATIKKMVKDDSYWIPVNEIKDHIFLRNSTKEKREASSVKRAEFTKAKLSQMSDVWEMNELVVSINKDIKDKDAFSYALWLDSDNRIGDYWIEGMSDRILAENEAPTIFHDRESHTTTIGDMAKRVEGGKTVYLFKGKTLERNVILPEYSEVSIETWNNNIKILRKRIKNILESASDVINGKISQRAKANAPKAKTAKTIEYHKSMYTASDFKNAAFIKSKKAQEYYASKDLNELNEKFNMTTEMHRKTVEDIIKAIHDSDKSVKESFETIKGWLKEGIEGAKDIHTLKGKKQYKLNLIMDRAKELTDMSGYNNESIEALYSYIKTITKVLPYYIWIEEVQTRLEYEQMMKEIKKEREAIIRNKSKQ